MGDRILEQIVQLENGLQRQLEQETARAAAWRDGELADLDRRLESAVAATDEQDRLVIEREVAAAEREAAVLEENERTRCRRLAELSDSDLQRLLLRHLEAILPESLHDHPDGES